MELRNLNEVDVGNPAGEFKQSNQDLDHDFHGTPTTDNQARNMI